MNLEKFKAMTLEEQRKYDFVDTFADECIKEDSEYKREIEEVWNRIKTPTNPILKLNEWKYHRFFGKKIEHDCDSTELSLQIMSQCLFGEVGEIKYYTEFKRKSTEKKRLDFRKELVYKGESYMGDNMNSFQTIANITLNKILKKEYISHKLKEYNPKKTPKTLRGENTLKVLSELYTLLDENQETLLNDALQDDEKKDCKSILESLIKLASLTHTAGNFILVPSGTFNYARYAPTKDFFDLTLEGIRQFYINEEHTPLCGLLRFNHKNTN